MLLLSRGPGFLPLGLAFAAWIWLGGCAHEPPSKAAGKNFEFQKDTFAFANETVWSYEGGRPETVRREDGTLRRNETRYMRRCFVVSRAAVQFWKFARFVPGGKRLSGEDLMKRIRDVTGRDVWKEPLVTEKRVVFPGYRDLHEMSKVETRPLQENIGFGWPTYFRPGNFCIIAPPSRAHQERTNRELQTWLENKRPMILWLCNFPSLDINHAVVVFGEKKDRQRFVYQVYDPNYADRPGRLEYDPKTRSFYFEKTFYFSGGIVSVRPVYLSDLE